MKKFAIIKSQNTGLI